LKGLFGKINKKIAKKTADILVLKCMIIKKYRDEFEENEFERLEIKNNFPKDIL